MSAVSQLSPLDMLLSRLEGVKPYSKGWRARCPAHGSERNQALAIAGGDDGRVLLHCFAGCEPLAIVHAIDLELQSLFPQRITANLSPAQRRDLRQTAKQSQWYAALSVLDLEAKIVQIAGTQIRSGIPLDDNDNALLNQAIDRIESARLVLRA